MNIYKRMICTVLLLIVLSSNAYAGEMYDKSTHWGFEHKEGIVLVLSGGGTKGLAHIGVLEVLEREHIPIAAIVGTSMGAIMGGIYATGYTSDEMYKLAMSTNLTDIISGRRPYTVIGNDSHTPPASGVEPFLIQIDKNGVASGRRGLLSPKNLYNFLASKTAKTNESDFNNLPIPFAAIATNLETGDAEVLRSGNLASALRASMSIPGIFDPWEIGGKVLVDGGLRANLPVKIAKQIFPGHPIVAVNLSPKCIKRDRSQLRSLLEIGSQSLEILMVTQVRENVKEADFVISPDVSSFGVLDTTGYDKIIERGRFAAESKLSDLKTLVSKTCHINNSEEHSNRKYNTPLVVTELQFDGIPIEIVDKLYKRYQYILGTNVNMEHFAEIIRELSLSEDFLSVDGKIEHIGNDNARAHFKIERPDKYELALNGYIGNIHPDSWVSLSAQIRDILDNGDIGTLEYRLGNRWGFKGRYFSPLSSRRTQFGFLLSAIEERVDPSEGEFGINEFERYTARAMWYKQFGSFSKIGIGYMGERINSYDTEHGLSAMFTFNNLDDPILPTKGFLLKANAWFPFHESVIVDTSFQIHLPTWQKWKVVLSGGFKMGDEDYFPYAAFLGNKEELYSLAEHPIFGDQAYWVHLGADKILMRTWWGGINTEIFANYGQVLSDWNNNTSWWETGVALSLPLNNFAGKLFAVYDQDGEITLGYSFGVPTFWNGPLP